MKEFADDYYEEEHDNGCCLKCPDSYPGCLCYGCRCKKCCWYIPPEEFDGEKGHCGKVDSIIRKRKTVIPFPRDLKKTNINTQELIRTPEEWIQERIKEVGNNDKKR